MNKALKGVASFAVLLAIWQALAVSGWFPSSLFPGPVSVAQALVDRASSGQLVLDIGASMYRFFIGYLIACVSAVLLGLVMGWCTRAWDFLNPVVQFLRPISPVAWLPFIVLWLGIGDIPAIVAIFLAAFFPVLLSTVGAGEMAGTQSGLGFLIVDARNNLRTDELLAAIVVIGLLGVLLDWIIKQFEACVNRVWGTGVQGAEE